MLSPHDPSEIFSSASGPPHDVCFDSQWYQRERDDNREANDAHAEPRSKGDAVAYPPISGRARKRAGCRCESRQQRLWSARAVAGPRERLVLQPELVALENRPPVLIGPRASVVAEIFRFSFDRTIRKRAPSRSATFQRLSPATKHLDGLEDDALHASATLNSDNLLSFSCSIQPRARSPIRCRSALSMRRSRSRPIRCRPCGSNSKPRSAKRSRSIALPPKALSLKPGRP